MIKSKYLNIRKKIFDPLAWQLSKKELKAGMEKASTNIEDLLKFTEKYTGRGYYSSLHCYQNKFEILSLVKLLQKYQPGNVLEIGTHKGGTFFLWCRAVKNAKLFVSIDLPYGRFGGGYVKERERLLKEFIFDKPNSEMFLIRDDSHNLSTYEKVSQIIQGENLDFLFIDGDHTYEGVKKDFDLYSKFVNSGIIAFHDIAHKEGDYGVVQLWHEIKVNYHTQEFIDKNSNKGIGVVFIS
jgi:cephalosporin hydroxylase